MNVLICCETSGMVREAFRARGHEAWSCDLLPAEDGSKHHLVRDMRLVVDGCQSWDLVGFHPSCQYLNGAGIHWNNRGRGWENTEAAVETVKWCMEHDMPWYLENPVGIISTRIRKPDQIIQPYEFGDDASKKTCLWLKGLTPLERLPKSEWAKPRRVCKCGCNYTSEAMSCPECGAGFSHSKPRWSNQTDSGQNKLGPSKDRWKERSKTYPGIAEAMAAQWSAFALSSPTPCLNANAAESLGALFTWNITPIANASDQATQKTKAGS